MIETVSESIPIRVSSEIGRLQKVMIHSPDGGIGNVPTNKLHDWLYDDIVDIDKILMRASVKASVSAVLHT